MRIHPAEKHPCSDCLVRVPQDLLYFACEQYRPDVLLLCTRRLLQGKLKQVRPHRTLDYA